MQHDKNGNELGTRDNPIELTKNMHISYDGRLWYTTYYGLEDTATTDTDEEMILVIEAEGAT